MRRDIRFALSLPEVIACAVFPIVALSLTNALYKEALITHAPALYWLQDGLTFVFFPVAGAALLALVANCRPADYGFKPIGNATALLEVAGLSVLALIAFALSYGFGLRLGASLWPGEGTISALTSLLPAGIAPRMLVVIYLSVTAGVVEEAVYRGLPWVYVQQHCVPRWRVPAYMLASALVFAFIHSEQGLHAILATFLLGLVWALLYTRIENIWPFIIAHTAADVWSFWS